MTLRRYSEMRPSQGTVIPADMRIRVLERDQGCVGAGRFDIAEGGRLELDHVRASHGVGLKSVTCDCNLVALCGACHRYKTEHGKDARPILLEYLATFGYTEHRDGHLNDSAVEAEHTHVEPVYGCARCAEAWA